MCLYWSLFVHIGGYRSLCVFMGPYVCIRVLIGSYWSFYVLSSPYESLCVFRSLCGSL